MDVEAFKASLAGVAPPDDASPLLRALWHQGRGDWDAAHRIAQDQPDPEGAWVHAHLHRAEGDADNAGYWYRRAGQPFPDGSLEEEWDAIATALLSRRAK